MAAGAPAGYFRLFAPLLLPVRLPQQQCLRRAAGDVPRFFRTPRFPGPLGTGHADAGAVSDYLQSARRRSPDSERRRRLLRNAPVQGSARHSEKSADSRVPRRRRAAPAAHAALHRASPPGQPDDDAARPDGDARLADCAGRLALRHALPGGTGSRALGRLAQAHCLPAVRACLVPAVRTFPAEPVCGADVSGVSVRRRLFHHGAGNERRCGFGRCLGRPFHGLFRLLPLHHAGVCHAAARRSPPAPGPCFRGVRPRMAPPFLLFFFP